MPTNAVHLRRYPDVRLSNLNVLRTGTCGVSKVQAIYCAVKTSKVFANSVCSREAGYFQSCMLENP